MHFDICIFCFPDVPAPPTNIQGEALSQTSVRLFWDANPDPSTEYIVEYNLPFQSLGKR